MEKLFLLKIVLIVIIAVSLAAFFKASYDNDDSTLDFLSGGNNFLLYACFLLILLPCIGVSYINIDNFTYPELLVSYLSSKEKSPPALFFDQYPQKYNYFIN